MLFPRRGILIVFGCFSQIFHKTSMLEYPLDNFPHTLITRSFTGCNYSAVHCTVHLIRTRIASAHRTQLSTSCNNCTLMIVRLTNQSSTLSLCLSLYGRFGCSRFLCGVAALNFGIGLIRVVSEHAQYAIVAVFLILYGGAARCGAIHLATQCDMSQTNQRHHRR